MSQVQDFMERVRGDESLRQQVMGLGRDMGSVIALAKREGYNFTQADFEAALKERGYEVGVELSEQDLAEVAGGTDVGTAAETLCGENT